MKKFRVLVNGSEYKVEIEELSDDTSIPQPVAPVPKATPAPSTKPAAPTKPTPAKAEIATNGGITAPMPGTVLRIEVEVGATVNKGQTLLVLEAMKMENEIQAPADGKVQELNVAQGVSVNAGDTLIVLS